mgnify:CR=1 FL=1
MIRPLIRKDNSDWTRALISPVLVMLSDQGSAFTVTVSTSLAGFSAASSVGAQAIREAQEHATIRIERNRRMDAP